MSPHSPPTRTQGPSPPSTPPLFGRGQLLILAAAILWSLGGVYVKLLVGGQGLSPAAIACLRSAMAGVCLSWALPGIRGVPRWRALLAALAFSGAVGSFVRSTAGTSAANAIALQYAYPLIVAVGAVILFREPLPFRSAAAVALGTLGVAVILYCSWEPSQAEGLLYGVASAVTFAVFLLVQRSIRTGSPAGLASLHNLVAAAILFPAALGHLEWKPAALGILASMAILQLGLPYVLFIQGLKTVRATDAALITLIEPVLNPLWVYAALGEVPEWSTVGGGCLILVALVVRFTA